MRPVLSGRDEIVQQKWLVMKPKALQSAFCAMDYREALGSAAGTEHVTSSCGGVLLRIRLKPVSNIYQDSVCRDSVLPNCSGPGEPPKPTIYRGEDLARGAALGTAGLSKPDFFNYLWWLLNGRAVDVDEFKITPRLGFSLFGTSDASGKVISKTFRTYDDLEVWAEDALNN